MEEHMPETRGRMQLESRTRDSSFSVDSDENYFCLPEDEEEFLTKEFSSVYEDVQSERLATMSKDELLQEHLLLQARYDALAKRLASGRVEPQYPGEELQSRLAQQEDLISDLRASVQTLTLQLASSSGRRSSSADSESDSSSSCSSISSSSSNRSHHNHNGPAPVMMNGHVSPPPPPPNSSNPRSLTNGGHAYSPAERPD